MSAWKTAFRSFYYEEAPEPDDIVLRHAETALLVIDIQNTYLEPKDDPREATRWAPFFARMRGTVVRVFAGEDDPGPRRMAAQFTGFASPRDRERLESRIAARACCWPA